MQRQVIVTNCSKLQKRRLQHRRTKDCRTRSKKSGVLTMSVEATTIHTVRSFTVGSDISYTSDFKFPSRRNPRDWGLGKVEVKQQVHRVQSKLSRSRWPWSNPPPRICSMEVVTHRS
ncbi:hypothetical protein TNCV_3408451 [Trichonephila clavipes]|nr:hypothetical protein TNCV_3408451 [Trichonephila clavipes]